MNFISLLPLREAESDSHVRRFMSALQLRRKKTMDGDNFSYIRSVFQRLQKIYFTFTPAVYWADNLTGGAIFRQSQTDATQQPRPFDVMYLLQHESLVTNK